MFMIMLFPLNYTFYKNFPRETMNTGFSSQVKQLRLEREREKAMRETELEMLQREKEAEHFKTWAEQEDNFHLQQAKLRLVISR